MRLRLQTQRLTEDPDETTSGANDEAGFWLTPAAEYKFGSHEHRQGAAHNDR